MLSAQASCLEIRLSFLLFFFFCCYFFSWVLLSFSRRGEKKGKKGVEEGRRWDESGVRQDLRRAVWTGPNLGELMKNIDSCSHSQGLRSWKTNLKHNLGNQLRSPWEPGEKKRKRRERSTLLTPHLLVFSFPPLNRNLGLPIRTLPCVRRLCQQGPYLIFFFTAQGLICCQNVLRVLLKKCHSSFPCNAIHMLVKGGMSKDLNSFAF